MKRYIQILSLVFTCSLYSFIVSGQRMAICSSNGSTITIQTETYHNGLGAVFYFGKGDPRNKSHVAFSTKNTQNGGEASFSIPCESPLTFQMKYFSLGVEQNDFFIDGVLCEDCSDGINGNSECAEMMEKCGVDIIGLIYDNENQILCKQWITDCNITSNIYRNGSVSIGTSLFAENSKLSVTDGIITDRLRVELCEISSWCDYVFEKGYHLKPLAEVASFIEKRQHLPGMPSQNEIEERGGFELKEITIKQQEKIEEAFLHLISLEKEINELEKEITGLQKNNSALRSY